MPPATQPVPVLVLDSVKAACALPDGGANYYHQVKAVVFGRDPLTDEQVALAGFPYIVIGQPGECGQYVRTEGALWHGDWAWDVPVYGVLQDVGTGDEAYRSLQRLAADILRAVMVDFQRSGTSIVTEVQGWSVVGPQDLTQGHPSVEMIVRVIFRTRFNEMVTNPA